MDVIIRAPNLAYAEQSISTIQVLFDTDIRFIAVVQSELSDSDYPNNVVSILYPDEDYNYSKALNIGLSVCRSELVLICSSHSIVSGSMASFKNAAQYLQDNPACAAISFKERAQLSHKTSANTNYEEPISVDKSNFDGFNGINNSCSIIKRNIWSQYPFDESIVSAEDQYWTASLITKKYYIAHWSGPFYYDYRNTRSCIYKEARDMIIISRALRPDIRRTTYLLIESLRALKNITSFNIRKGRIRFCFIALVVFDRIIGLKLSSKY